MSGIDRHAIEHRGAPRGSSGPAPALLAGDRLPPITGMRALDLLEQALNEATAAEHADGGLHALVAALIPIGPQLAFL